MATARQEAAIAYMAENGRNVSAAMRAVGFSPETAKVPGKLTKSKGFQELMDKYLPERHLMEKHRAFLDSPRLIRRFRKGDLQEEIEETDPNAVKALDMAYKLKGKYKDTVSNNVLIINVSKESADRYSSVHVNTEDTTDADISGDHPANNP